VSEHIELVKNLTSYRAKMVDVLGARSDAEVVPALGLILEAVPIHPEATPVIEELLERATAESIGYVMDSMESLLDTYVRRGAARIKLAKRSLGRKPRDWAGSAVAWESKQRRQRDFELAVHDKSDEKLNRWAFGFSKSLIDFAKARDLPAPPRKMIPIEAWREWHAGISYSL
jgi:hypothetical protein